MRFNPRVTQQGIWFGLIYGITGFIPSLGNSRHQYCGKRLFVLVSLDWVWEGDSFYSTWHGREKREKLRKERCYKTSQQPLLSPEGNAMAAVHSNQPQQTVCHCVTAFPQTRSASAQGSLPAWVPPLPLPQDLQMRVLWCFGLFKLSNEVILFSIIIKSHDSGLYASALYITLITIFGNHFKAVIFYTDGIPSSLFLWFLLNSFPFYPILLSIVPVKE